MMKLKVSHDDLEIISNEIISDSSSLDDVLKIWKENISMLSSVWQGEDASLFFDNVNNYLEYMNNAVLFFDGMGKFLKDANVKYRETDLAAGNDFSKALMEEDKNV